jgi:hypothetical protein
MPDQLFDPELEDLAHRAIERLCRGLSRDAPWLAAEAIVWMNSLTRSGRAEDYFLEDRSLLLLLPDQLIQRICAASDDGFRSDLAYSTINAYYFVRLIDNVMDARCAAESRLLPLAGFFHSRFQGAYSRYFPPESGFWGFFESTWARMAEATTQAAGMTEFTADDFARISRAKFGGGKIPVAAACFRYNRPDLLGPWCAFYDLFACWSQTVDDLVDWMNDSSAGTATYFLSEANRRKRHDESAAVWILREGFAWGYAESEMRMRQLQSVAKELRSESLTRYLACREEQMASLWRRLQPQLAPLARLAVVLE